MVQIAPERLRNALIAICFSSLAVAVLLALRYVRADRPAAEEAMAVNPVAPTSGLASIRLNRPQIASAAGIEVEPVQIKNVSDTITCNGSAAFNNNRYVKVPSKAAGILQTINVDVGAAVRTGDELAVVNSQTVGDLKASLVRANIHEEHSRWVIARYEELGEGIRMKDLFEERHLLEEELTETRRIRERLSELGFTTKQIDDVVETQDSGIQLTVFAPRAGTIVQRQAVEGEPVDTTTPLFAIADLSSMWVHLNTYESNLPQIRLGQSVTFYPDGLPGQGFVGRITWISPEVDSRTRTIALRAEVANQEGALRANMFGRGELIVERTRGRMVVPQAAVQSHQGQHIVFVRKSDDEFEVRPVIVGLKSAPFWEVTSGVELGELVATQGSFLLKSNLENPDFGKVE